MSSTDAAIEKRLRRFFAEQIAPAAERLRRRGVAFFALRGEAAVESYYETHEPGQSLFLQIEPASVERALKELWQRQGLPELVDLAGPLLALAPQLKPAEQDAGDVSPFIYAMF